MVREGDGDPQRSMGFCFHDAFMLQKPGGEVRSWARAGSRHARGPSLGVQRVLAQLALRHGLPEALHIGGEPVNIRAAEGWAGRHHLRVHHLKDLAVPFATRPSELPDVAFARAPSRSVCHMNSRLEQNLTDLRGSLLALGNTKRSWHSKTPGSTSRPAAAPKSSGGPSRQARR